MIRYIRVMKSGSTSVTEWLRGVDKPDGHSPAWVVRDEEPDALLWATVRSPWEWYRSWYSHLLRAYGGKLDGRSVAGSWGHDFKSALYNFTHGGGPAYDASRYQKHLYNPAGWFLDPRSEESVMMWGENPPGLWSRMIEWMLRDQDGWVVDAVVPVEHAEGYLRSLYPRIDRRLDCLNASPDLGIRGDEDQHRWIREADGDMVEEIRETFGFDLFSRVSK